MKTLPAIAGIILVAIGGFGKALKLYKFQKTLPAKPNYTNFIKDFNKNKQGIESKKFEYLIAIGLIISIFSIFQ